MIGYYSPPWNSIDESGTQHAGLAAAAGGICLANRNALGIDLHARVPEADERPTIPRVPAYTSVMEGFPHDSMGLSAALYAMINRIYRPPMFTDTLSVA